MTTKVAASELRPVAATIAAAGVDARGNRAAVVFLGFVAALVAAVQVVAALSLDVPWIVPDELIYSELAKSIGDGSLPSVRGEATLGYGLLYPLVLAPAWALFESPADAFVAAKIINAAVMGLAVFPAFFLARRFVSLRSAVVVAVLSILVPSMLYSGTLLIETVLYPVFLLALLGLVAALQNPSRRNQLLALGGIVLACSAKPLAVILAPAYVLAVLHLGLLDRRSGGSVRERASRHAYALTLLGAGAVLGIVVPFVLGDVDAVLGVYGVVLGNVDLSGMLVWLVRHAAGLDLYVGIVPFVASLVVIARSTAGKSDERANEFAALAVWTIGGTLAAIAAYASKPLAGAEGYIPSEARLHERNMFVLAPLLLIGLALFLERPRQAERRVVVPALALGIALPFALPLEKLLENASFQALGLIPYTADGVYELWPFSLLPLAIAAAYVLLRGPATRGAWALVGTVFLVTAVSAQASMAHPDGGASSTLGVGYDKRWIDDAVPEGESVLALWVPPTGEQNVGRAQRTIWMGEFFNRQLGRVVELGRPAMEYALPHDEGVIRGGVLRVAGKPVAARYVLAPCWVSVVGRPVAADRRVEARVYEVSGPVRLTPLARPDPGCGPDADRTRG